MLRKRLLYSFRWRARPRTGFGFSCFCTFGVLLRTLPACAREPWTLPIRKGRCSQYWTTLFEHSLLYENSHPRPFLNSISYSIVYSAPFVFLHSSYRLSVFKSTELFLFDTATAKSSFETRGFTSSAGIFTNCCVSNKFNSCVNTA